MPNKVKIQIDGNNKGAVTAINGVKPPLRSVGHSVDKLKTKMSTSFGAMGNIISGLKTKMTLMGIAAVAAFGYMIKSAIDAAESLEKMSQRVGLSVEFLSTLRHATELSGTEITVMEKALQRMSRTLFDANRGLLTAKIPFDELGVAVADSMGQLRSGEVVLLDVADKFARMEDGTRKTALALQIFGRAGADLIPLLNSGADGIGRMQQEARSLGLEISTNTAKNAAEFKDNMLALERSVSGVANVMIEPLLPTLVKISEGMKTASGDVEGLKGHFESLNGVLKVVASVGAISALHIANVFTGIAGIIKTNIKVFTLQFGDAIDEIGGTLDQFGSNYATFGDFISSIWSDAAKDFKVFTDSQLFWNQYVGDIDNATNSLGPFRGELEAITITAQSTAREIRILGQEMILLQNPPAPVDVSVFQANNEMIKAGITDITDFELAQYSIRMLEGQNFYNNMAGAALGFYQASGQASKEWFAVYKAFAIAQTAISTYEGAVAAYKAMAGIPVVGPFLGIAAAGALTAYGLGNIARISAMQPGGGFGGGIPSSTPSLPGNTINNSTDTRNFDFNIVINTQGNLDPDQLDAIARDLIVSLRKAEGDGA